MRIAYLLPAPGIPVQGPTGASAHARGFVAGLRAEGHDVRFYAVRTADERGRFGEAVDHVATGTGRWTSARFRDYAEILASRGLARRVIEDAHAGWVPEMVIERHALFSDAAWRVADRFGVPWALEVNAPPTIERRRFDTLARPDLAAAWERKVLRAAPAIIAVSRWLVDWLEREIGSRGVAWVPNGVHAWKGKRRRGRELLGADPAEPLVGFVGSFRPWHGVERLGEIAAGAGGRLVAVGAIDAATRALLPEDALTPGHLGPRDLADVAAAIDVGVAPYRSDAPEWFCPMKVFDFRAQGTPVVASNLGDLRFLVQDGGSVVPPDDTAAFVRAVRGWLRRRAEPRVRSWRTVARQVLGAPRPRLVPG